jgi:hypothetical protein
MLLTLQKQIERSHHEVWVDSVILILGGILRYVVGCISGLVISFMADQELAVSVAAKHQSEHSRKRVDVGVRDTPFEVSVPD